MQLLAILAKKFSRFKEADVVCMRYCSAPSAWEIIALSRSKGLPSPLSNPKARSTSVSRVMENWVVSLNYLDGCP
jgi:hypothetical protein